MPATAQTENAQETMTAEERDAETVRLMQLAIEEAKSGVFQRKLKAEKKRAKSNDEAK